jgi:hypothetical protein
MNIVNTIEQYNEDFIYFCEPIKNNIMNDGKFIRIMYSTPLITLNGIYILINFSYTSIDKYYNKFKCNFDATKHSNIIEKIFVLEEGLLKKSNIQGKTPQYKLYEQLKTGNIKFLLNTMANIDKINSAFLLKVAGVWETDTEYGLTFKFISP